LWSETEPPELIGQYLPNEQLGESGDSEVPGCCRHSGGQHWTNLSEAPASVLERLNPVSEEKLALVLVEKGCSEAETISQDCR
jgi:hypothetical protein